MKLLKHLFENNDAWANRSVAEDPGFFDRHSGQQAPPYFWIGCCDSRIPANLIVGLPPGEVFVHRNIANLLSNHDDSSLAALQYAIQLGVEHLLIVGHYCCGGVRAAMSADPLPDPLNQWLEPVRGIHRESHARLAALADDEARWDLLCELNVIEQVRVAAALPMVRQAWDRGAQFAVHGWIYDVRNGRLRDLNVTMTA